MSGTTTTRRSRARSRLIAVFVGCACGLSVAACGSTIHRDASKGRTTAGSGAGAARAGASRTLDCFFEPGVCGYPDPRYGNVGASSACSSLPVHNGDLYSSSNGQKIEGMNIEGQLTIHNANVTVSNVCVTYDGHSAGGSAATQILPGAKNTVIKNATIAAAGSGATGSTDIGIKNWSSEPATLSHVYIYNCGECIHDGPWAVNDSYIISNGMQGTGEHYEAVYYNNDVVSPGMSFIHDVLLNPEDQSGVIYSDNTTPKKTCAVNLSVEESLIAGGGRMIVWCGASTSPGAARLNVRRNHFARCTTPPLMASRDGGMNCSGSTGTGIAAGSDRHGYWPAGGHYGGNGFLRCGGPGVTYTRDNVWDDNGAVLPCQS